MYSTEQVSLSPIRIRFLDVGKSALLCRVLNILRNDEKLGATSCHVLLEMNQRLHVAYAKYGIIQPHFLEYADSLVKWVR